MNQNTEHRYIEKCCQLIECRLEWKESNDWRNRDFEYLSELIFDKTKTSISLSTLKRIWKNSSERTPHVSTLNALAQYLDYADWNIFKAKMKSELNSKKEQEKTNLISGRRMLIACVLLTIVAGTFLLITNIEFRSSVKEGKDLFNNKTVLFTSAKTVSSGLPNTVVFNYDISTLGADSAFIQQDWDAKKRTEISETDNYHTSIYYYPGYYKAKLILNDTIAKEHPLFITTDNWMGVYMKTPFQEIPIYLKNIQLAKENRLHISVEDLLKNKIQNDKDYYTGLYNYQDFGDVLCDNFSLESIVRNNPAEGGLTCSYVLIAVEAENGLMSASFCDAGCTSNLFLRFSNVYFDGKKNDLSAFGVDLSEWRKIKFEVVNKQVKVLIDDKEIYDLSFNLNIGKVIGLSYMFYGSGSLKEVRLTDGKGEIKFEDDFK